MQEEEPLPSGCRVLMSIRILSLSSPEVVGLVQKSSSSFISVQLRRGKKLSSAIDQFRIDEDGTSLVFSVSLTMCAVLFGDGMGSFYDSFGKLIISLGLLKGIAVLPLHELRVTNGEHQQLVLPATFSHAQDDLPCRLNMTVVTTFIEDVYHEVVSILSDNESTDDEEDDDVEAEDFELEQVDFDDGGFYGRSMVDRLPHYHFAVITKIRFSLTTTTFGDVSLRRIFNPKRALRRTWCRTLILVLSKLQSHLGN